MSDLNGDMCQVCGECIDMDCGYPMVCEGCIEDGECEFFNQRVLSAMERAINLVRNLGRTSITRR